jgi:tetratricopeptide (TPR) repeat protein
MAIATAANSHEEAAALANFTWMTVLLGDVRRAGELHEDIRRLADRIGLESYISWQRAEHVFHCHWEGRWDEAVATADEFIREAEAGAGHYMATACHYIRGSIELARGDADAAVADGTRAVELARAAKDPQSLHPALAFAARAMLAAGNAAGAGSVCDELLASWRGMGVRAPHEVVDGAWALSDLGRGQELIDAVEGTDARFPWHEAACLIAAGDFGSAAEVYAEIGSVPDGAYARLRAADDLMQRGRRAEADTQLRLALPVFAALGASAWQVEAQALLAASA